MSRPNFTDRASEPPMAEATADPSIESLVDQHESALLRYVGHLLGRVDDAAEDVVQEAFLRLHRQRQKHGDDSVRDPSVWLFRVAHNLAMDTGRKRSRRRRAQDRIVADAVEREDSENSIDALGQIARAEACERALAQVAQLPEGQRHVVTLRIIQGMTMQQIGDVLGISPSNVCYRLNTALRTLAGRLRREGVI